jgi:hypothetical protein
MPCKVVRRHGKASMIDRRVRDAMIRRIRGFNAMRPSVRIHRPFYLGWKAVLCNVQNFLRI